MRLKNATFEKKFETGVDIRKWLPGENTERIEIAFPCDFPVGEYELQIGIGGNLPSVFFAANAPQDREYSVLTKVELI